MLITAKEAERDALLSAAKRMCAAARTAPKTKGDDLIETAILTDGELEALAAEMERLSVELSYGFFLRDAANIRQSGAVVLLGVHNRPRGLGDGCGYCNFQNCADCASKGGLCAYGPIDLGIAVGAAVFAPTAHSIAVVAHSEVAPPSVNALRSPLTFRSTFLYPA